MVFDVVVLAVVIIGWLIMSNERFTFSTSLFDRGKLNSTRFVFAMFKTEIEFGTGITGLQLPELKTNRKIIVTINTRKIFFFLASFSFVCMLAFSQRKKQKKIFAYIYIHIFIIFF